MQQLKIEQLFCKDWLRSSTNCFSDEIEGKIHFRLSGLLLDVLRNMVKEVKNVDHLNCEDANCARMSSFISTKVRILCKLVA